MYAVELPIKVKPIQCERLIVAPKIDNVLKLINNVSDSYVKVYLPKTGNGKF